MRRWSVAAGVVLATGLVLHPISLAPSSEIVRGAGVLSWLGFAVALTKGRWSLGGAAAGLFVTQYALALVLRPIVDLLAPVAALGLLVVMELVDASAARARRREVEPSTARKYLRDTGSIAVLGTLAASWVAVAGLQGRGGETLRLVVGAACALGAVVATAMMVTQPMAEERRPSGEPTKTEEGVDRD